MNDIRVLIVDDEALAREYLRDLLGGCPEISIVGEAKNGAEAVKALQAGGVDVVFLDVQMPELSGMEVIEKVGAENMPVVVFVTAFDSYAIDAFELSATDYLLKPFSRERFGATIEKVRNEVRRASTEKAGQKLFDAVREYQSNLVAGEDSSSDLNSGNAENTETYISRIPVKERKTVTLISVIDIDWIEAADDYVILHVQGKDHLLKESLQNLEAKLDPATFTRIHRGAIVHLDRIDSLQSLSSGDFQAKLTDGSLVKVSRRRKKALEKSLGRSL